MVDIQNSTPTFFKGLRYWTTSLMNKKIGIEFFRFLLAGAINTLLSYLLYLSLLTFLSYMSAYTIAYCAGILISYFFNVLFVFKYRLSVTSFLKFPIVYVLQYVIGASTLWVLVGKVAISPVIAMIGVLIITIPVTFLTSRLILTPRKEPPKNNFTQIP